MSLEDNDEEYVDIVSELSPRCPHLVEHIFKYLTARELCLISCVSKRWQTACLETFWANKRRMKYLRKVRKLRKSVGQENWPIKKRTSVTSTSRDAFSDIKNVYRTRQSVNNRLSSNSRNTTTARTGDMSTSLRAFR